MSVKPEKQSSRIEELGMVAGVGIGLVALGSTAAYLALGRPDAAGAALLIALADTAWIRRAMPRTGRINFKNN